MSAWSSEDHCITQRNPVYFKVLESVARNFGYQARVQYSFSSADRWTEERVIQILEDMLRACALDYGSSWDENLPYAEFSYNNSYQTSLKMAPFEALYGRRCRTPLLWDEVGDRQLFGPDLIKESE